MTKFLSLLIAASPFATLASYTPYGVERYAPFIPGSGGAVVGYDPHFKTWSGEKFSYHGKCDMVLLENKQFADGTGMDIHIRTEIQDSYSFIDSAVLRIGDETLEVQADAEDTLYWINGSFKPDLPTTISGYPITFKEKRTLKQKRHGKDLHDRMFMVDLGNGDSINFKITWVFGEYCIMVVKIDPGMPENFGASVGLFGDFGTGARFARDRMVIHSEDHNTHGQEWQVNEAVDPALFREKKGPQGGEKCAMPPPKRRLAAAVSKESAQAACAHLPDVDEMDFCVMDVLESNNLAYADNF